MHSFIDLMFWSFQNIRYGESSNNKLALRKISNSRLKKCYNVSHVNNPFMTDGCRIHSYSFVFHIQVKLYILTVLWNQLDWNWINWLIPKTAYFKFRNFKPTKKSFSTKSYLSVLKIFIWNGGGSSSTLLLYPIRETFYFYNSHAFPSFPWKVLSQNINYRIVFVSLKNDFFPLFSFKSASYCIPALHILKNENK